MPGCKSISSTLGECQAAEVKMTIQKIGLPLHKDATFWIRPRIFLEGNFFVDINPGTPSAPVAPSDYMFPMTRAASRCSSTRSLTSLQQNTRANLQILLQQYGQAVKQGGPAYNSSIQYWLPAYEYSSLVEHDLLGIQPHDLSNAIYTQGDVSQAINAHPQAAQEPDHRLQHHRACILRSSNANLAERGARAARTLWRGDPGLHALDRGSAPGADHAPRLRRGPAAEAGRRAASRPPVYDRCRWSTPASRSSKQLRQLVQPSELRGLTKDLSATVPALARLTVETIPFMRTACGRPRAAAPT